jgi:hypothetical protein
MEHTRAAWLTEAAGAAEQKGPEICSGSYWS